MDKNHIFITKVYIYRLDDTLRNGSYKRMKEDKKKNFVPFAMTMITRIFKHAVSRGAGFI